MAAALDAAIGVWKENKEEWRKLMRMAVRKQDVSWDNASEKYFHLYQSLL